MTALRSLLFNIYFVGLSVILGTLYLPFLLLPPRYFWPAARLWVRLTLLGLRLICGLESRLEGQKHLPQGAGLVAAKHQSAWDTLIFALLLPAPAMVLKRELLHVPFFGWYLRHLNMIAIDRRRGAAALQDMLRQARARLAEGRQIVIFPEGTRTAPGVVGRYQSGIAALYKALAVPVTPVALNSGRYWGRRAFNKRPGTIRLQALPPIPAGLERARFMECLKCSIEKGSAELDRESEQPSPAA